MVHERQLEILYHADQDLKNPWSESSKTALKSTRLSKHQKFIGRIMNSVFSKLSDLTVLEPSSRGVLNRKMDIKKDRQWWQRQSRTWLWRIDENSKRNIFWDTPFRFWHTLNVIWLYLALPAHCGSRCHAYLNQERAYSINAVSRRLWEKFQYEFIHAVESGLCGYWSIGEEVTCKA